MNPTEAIGQVPLVDDYDDEEIADECCGVCGELVEYCDCVVRGGRMRPVEDIPTGDYL